MPQDPLTAPVPVGTAVTGDGFEVEPAALRGAAGCLDAEAEALAGLAAAADGHLASLHGCWGDDEVGRRFAARYEPAATTVLGNLHALATGLARLATALDAVAAAYERSDALIADAESRAVAGLGADRTRPAAEVVA